MSTLESIFWHILGYSAIPIIFLIGISIAVGVFYFLLRMTGRDSEQ